MGRSTNKCIFYILIEVLSYSSWCSYNKLFLYCPDLYIRFSHKWKFYPSVNETRGSMWQKLWFVCNVTPSGWWYKNCKPNTVFRYWYAPSTLLNKELFVIFCFAMYFTFKIYKILVLFISEWIALRGLFLQLTILRSSFFVKINSNVTNKQDFNDVYFRMNYIMFIILK